MMFRTLSAGLACSAVVLSAHASSEIANLADDYSGFDTGTAVEGASTFGINGWSFATGGGTELTHDSNLVDGWLGQNAKGFNGTGSIFGQGGFPLISNEDIFTRGNVTPGGGVLAFHAGEDSDNEQLVITWTADKDYTEVVLDYEIERILGLHEAVDNATDQARTISMNITGPSGALVSLTPAFPDGRLSGQLNVGDVALGQTIVVTLGDGDGESGGDGSLANFTISGNVPEPGSLALLTAGALLLARRRRV